MMPRTIPPHQFTRETCLAQFKHVPTTCCKNEENCTDECIGFYNVDGHPHHLMKRLIICEDGTLVFLHLHPVKTT